MVTDTKTNNLRIVLHQIYVSLYVEFVVKNPLSPIEHPGGIGVNCEMFELGVEQFVVSLSWFGFLISDNLTMSRVECVLDELMITTKGHSNSILASLRPSASRSSPANPARCRTWLCSAAAVLTFPAFEA